MLDTSASARSSKIKLSFFPWRRPPPLTLPTATTANCYSDDIGILDRFRRTRMPADVQHKYRVVVRLPGNRPDHPLEDPPKIEWTAEKANILWEVIARARASDSGGADWKGLAAHLEVPLPYLLYRAQTRYEEDLRGLQEVRGALSPSAPPPPKSPNDEYPFSVDHPPISRRMSSALSSSTARLTTPLGVRARLNSLGQKSPSRPKKASSSSTLTLRNLRKAHVPLGPTSASSSEEDTNSEDEAAAKEEEVERTAEEQEMLDKKLRKLQKMMTNDTIGLVSSVRQKKGKTRESIAVDRGRMGMSSSQPTLPRGSRNDRDGRSQSVSSTSSPQGSIPSIPSPPPDSQPHSPMSRHLSKGKSTSPPALSPNSAHGRSARMSYRPMVAHAGTATSEEGSSAHGSSASSFSDLSDASLSASALESALLSNIKGGGSRLSAFTRSRLGGRNAGTPH